MKQTYLSPNRPLSASAAVFPVVVVVVVVAAAAASHELS